MYFHQDQAGHKIDLSPGKVVCVGRNYVAHIHELNNELPDEALLFIKPSTALCSFSQPLVIPKSKGSCHNEIELAVLLGTPLCNATPCQAKAAIYGIGLGLDLTLRDMQDKLKSKGHPWERAKAFDYSCPVSGFVASADIDVEQNIAFNLQVNGEIRQQGNSQDMLRTITALLVEISQSFTLLPGDIVLTGTPKGVAPLHTGDNLAGELTGHFIIQTQVL
ncbi:MAG: 2-keto-4-pentenoate hydratase/2-oxohepta-3-ene-1,7-dioic acid hydratase in catechol pathway [Paraglaciecola sp.]|jgi:2-keto-4-pentenoate hydratase/2-oxohepta-3-ene-1,7-dioic acid hydratase in catechol pathway